MQTGIQHIQFYASAKKLHTHQQTNLEIIAVNNSVTTVILMIMIIADIKIMVITILIIMIITDINIMIITTLIVMSIMVTLSKKKIKREIRLFDWLHSLFPPKVVKCHGNISVKEQRT